ncbi:VirB3 family type IV secretion system protein [Lyticum sinuosum]|uniref:Type IV secretion system protein VirB3 n=1 Tax=Lyticum sinuosum TaxID=1332059 RepID=A0AAE5AGJ7_9RICK|nr:VirB3 family type IV secretion system protein [Lyticum sinuosum]MDZ5760862.1 Type IV secretion system protein VirB3 [Lyticum sinuosum]
MPEEGKLYSDILFLGLTRSPTILGVSYIAVGVNFISCLLGFIITSNPKIMLLTIFIHFILYKISSKEVLFLELLMTGSKCQKGRINKLYHKASSYDPS